MEISFSMRTLGEHGLLTEAHVERAQSLHVYVVSLKVEPASKDAGGIWTGAPEVRPGLAL